MTQLGKRLNWMGRAALLVAVVAGYTGPVPAPATTEAVSERAVETQPVIISGDRIHAIQGAGLRSLLEGKAVTNVAGVVTAFCADGFYMQDPNPDEDEDTSEGIFVFTGVVPRVRPGDAVLAYFKLQK